MAKQFSQLDGNSLIALSSGFESLKQQTGGQWRWGTACSGSEVVFCALEALQRFWTKRVADVSEIEHAFSCEQVEFKPEWIHEFFSPQHMFGDIHRLSGDSVQDIDGKDITNLACDVFAAGVECDSISSLNKQMTEGFDALHEASGQPSKTGDTARSAMAFLHKSRPPIAIIENVKNLACVGKSGQSNLSWLVQSANQLGYYVVDLVLAASSFGVPQQRERVYLLFVFVDDFADQTHADAKQPNWAFELKSFIKAMEIESFGLHEFLLQDSDPDVVVANGQLAVAEATKRRKKPALKGKAKEGEDADEASMPATRDVQKYEVEHLDVYSQHKLVWPPVFQRIFWRRGHAGQLVALMFALGCDFCFATCEL